MVLNLVSDENGLDISFISYNVTFIDRCAQFTVTLKYKNLSSLPLPLKFKNDGRDLGILIQLESKIGEEVGAFKIENSNLTSIDYPLLKSYGMSPEIENSGCGSGSGSSDNNNNNNNNNNSLVHGDINIEELIKNMTIDQYYDNKVSMMNIVDLMPGKEITMISKYLKELPTIKTNNNNSNNSKSNPNIDSSNGDEIISITIPKQTSITSPFPPINIEITVDGEVSIPLHSSVCPSHPSSISSLTLCENIISSKHDIKSNSLLNDDFNLLIGLESELHHSGWTTCTLSPSSSPPLLSSSPNSLPPTTVISTLINLNQPTPPLVDRVSFNNVEYSLNSSSTTTTTYSNNKQTIIYSLNNDNNNNNTNNTNNNNNNNVILKYNNNKEFNLLLKTPTLPSSSSILNKFSSLSKIQQLCKNNDNNSNNNDNNNNKNNDNNNDNKNNDNNIDTGTGLDIGTLLNIIFTTSNNNSNLVNNNNNNNNSNTIVSPLSQSAPPINNNNNSNKDISMIEQNITTTSSPPTTITTTSPPLPKLQESGELLSNMLSNLPKAKLGGLNQQSLTAPPSVGKDLSNPIADFIASRAAAGGSSGSNKPKKGPPPKLGGLGGGLNTSTGAGGIGDVRVQRLASYNKVNQLWNVSSSDFAQRVSITLRELEPYAIDYALSHIKSKWWDKNRIATLAEIKCIHSIISSIINSPKINLTYISPSPSSNSSNSDAKDQTSTTTTTTTTSSPTPSASDVAASRFLLQKGSFTDLTKLMGKPQSSSSSSLLSPSSSLNPSPSTSSNSLLSPSSPSKTRKEVEMEIDPVKLRWIVEEVLNGEKASIENSNNNNNNNGNKWFSVSIGETKGGRPHMEDNHVILEYPYELYGLEKKKSVDSIAGANSNNSNNNCINVLSSNEQFFFGVFDGHNGKIAAEYSRINLPYEIFNSFIKINKVGNSANNNNNNVDDLCLEAIKQGYLNTDKYFLDYAESDNKKAGTTVATVILERERFIVSNAGDTEVVLCSGGIAEPLSIIHTPKLDTERIRIESAGGSIIHYGTLRVNGLLSVSRSIGDKNLKEFIIPNPDSHIHNINKPNDQFLMIATDGLWEVFNHQDVVNEVLKLLQDKTIQKDDISSIIVEEAIKRNSKDNITLIIIFFNQN
ncbi:hypothetical protein ACTFIW_011665 [Dictyostelium discoideum]